MAGDDPEKPARTPPPTPRQRREAEALRANLARRKAQARRRVAEPPPGARPKS